MSEATFNQQVAEKLVEAAELLEQQGANPFRVNAYRRASATVAGLDRDLGELVNERGQDALVALPNIGKGIAAAVVELAATGRWSQLERLRGTLDPTHLFQTVPGIGPELAERIHTGLHVDTLEGLETAAHDGRLATVHGIGRRRSAAIRAELASILGRVHGRHAGRPVSGPSVALVLAVDADYRKQAAAGSLPTIAPRRFNPDGKAWLPILHAAREDWHFTALYSNTPRAHELGRTHDWVIVYFYDDHHREGQNTVVTENRGALMGRRVVRGREPDCRAYYARDS